MYDSYILLCTGVRLSVGWLSVRLPVSLGLRLAIGLGLGIGLGLEIGIADLNQIANLKLSILAPIQIADLNLTRCIYKLHWVTNSLTHITYL